MEEIQTKELELRVFSLPERASFITIHNEPTLIRANEFLKTVKTLRKEVDDTFDPISTKQYAAFKETKNQKGRFEQPLKEAEIIVKGLISCYMQKLAREREEAEAKQREKEEKRFQDARDADKIGLEEKAKEIREDDTKLAPIPEPTKLEGTHIKKLWRWKIVDVDKIPREYMTADVLKINAQVKAFKDKTNIPGIKVYQESIVASSSKF